jgi:hypothetical protein
LKDTVSHLSSEGRSGNGFVFEHFNPDALHWAVNEAMSFYRRPAGEKERIISRIMRESVARFNHATCAQSYFNIYEQMLKRPLVLPEDPLPAKSGARKPAQSKTGVTRKKRAVPAVAEETVHEASQDLVRALPPASPHVGISL